MILYALTILSSAILLFLVQPLIGKFILPWFGGSASVWSTAMLFFQLLLLVGYAYSHILIRWLSRRRQVWLHLGLLVVSLLLMGVNLVAWRTPITPDARWAPTGERSPIVHELLTLTISVGLPYLVLSTTSPLVQAWFTSRYPGRSPYPLYALSNAGSILALVGYPLLIEPLTSIYGQARGWSVGYVGFALGVGTVAWSLLRLSEAPAQSRAPAVRCAPAARCERVPWWRPVFWLALSAVGSILLLGTTNQITQNVAAVPLLWVAPLALYLLTFVIVFGVDWGYGRWAIGLLLVATQLFGYVFPRGNAFPLAIQLGVYGLLLFSGCLVSHGELARLRPRAGDLTWFYLVQALGGALGGVAVNLVAPMLFRSTVEFPIALLACWGLAAVTVAADGRSPIAGRQWVQLVMVAVFALGIFSSLVALRSSVRGFNASTVAAERNFYGVLRVQDATLGDPPEAAYRMVHATTIHGIQFVDPALRGLPTSYFGPTSGVGAAVAHIQGMGDDRRIGVLGLGVGTLAAYGRPGDLLRFYEIDPEVIRYAEGQGGFFSYLQDSGAAVEIVPGDARLSLAREVGHSATYDLLVADVFSGDAPPVHLLTLEAFELYLAHLAPEGLLAVNISTTHLELAPMVAGLARRLELHGVLVEDLGDAAGLFRSRWVVLSRDPRSFEGAAWREGLDLETTYAARANTTGLRLWTDSYSNLLDVIRR